MKMRHFRRHKFKMHTSNDMLANALTGWLTIQAQSMLGAELTARMQWHVDLAPFGIEVFVVRVRSSVLC